MSAVNPYAPLWGLYFIVFHISRQMTVTYMSSDEVKAATKYAITYQPPYSNGAWKIQCFTNEQDAIEMINFYESCGTPAHFI
tara:strand:+ start:820 stop:1065 length:246 start_codon:yes stop_codon:yes gene_type:complete